MSSFYWLIIVWAFNELLKWEQEQNEEEDRESDEEDDLKY